jgi:hypothetical protein
VPIPFRLPFAAFVLAAVATSALAQQAIPEAPAIWREVSGVIDLGGVGTPNPVFTRPHMPAWRTTSDGRVGIRVEQPQVAGTAAFLRFGLMKPEMLNASLLVNTVTPTNMFDPTMFDHVLKDMDGTPGAFDWDGDPNWLTVHACLWDDQEITAVGGKDYYKIKVVVTSSGNVPSMGMRVVTTPVTVVVAHPKTVNAVIESVTQTPGTEQTKSGVWQGPTPGNPTLPRKLEGFGFEPAVAFHGRLLVVRVGTSDFTWHHPVTGVPHDAAQHMDIVYAWSIAADDPANAANWNAVYPITLAPDDTRLTSVGVGFALHEFRDAKGKVILDDSLLADEISYDLGGTYPWIDRDGDNLFLETILDTLSGKEAGIPKLYMSSVGHPMRYPYAAVPGDPLAIEGKENLGRHQGISVIGKWTHGKLVQLDDMVNDFDYAVGDDGPPIPTVPTNLGPQRRLVQIYAPATVPATTVIPPFLTNGISSPANGILLFSYGRSTVNMPLGENDNANIIDSIENKLNYRRHALTTAYRDIVWHVNNSKQTDQHVFDDSLDPDALIVANMTGALEYRRPPITAGDTEYFPWFHHWTGWDEAAQAFTSEVDKVHVQNAATALPSRWEVPTHGKVIGPGRIEPAAAGGVYGKGFWMDSTIGLEFAIPVQPTGTGAQTLAGKEWYCGLFVDCRFADDTTERRLLRFPNGGEVRLLGRHQVLFVNNSGLTVHRASIPAPLGTSSAKNDLLPEGGWAHLAVQLRDSGKDVELLLNGMPLSRWRSNDTPLFDIVAQQSLHVGAMFGTSGAFRGWIDDFKLLAHTVDPETACNHAGGTLLGLTEAYAGVWKTEFANRFPAWTHAAISAGLLARGEEPSHSYACFYDYRVDNGNHPQALAALTAGASDVTSLRDNVHFPEGPLYHDAPRPFSVDNKFCISCHHVGGTDGLTLDALTFTTAWHAFNDPRRQPSQPPAKLFGNIPAGLVDFTGLPATPQVAPAAGTPVDPWLMPSWPGAAVVVNFTVLDAATQTELAVLASHPAGSTPTPLQLDPAVLGTKNLILRVNLDSAQRRVAAQLDGASPGSVVQYNAPYHVPVNLALLDQSATYTLQVTPLAGVTRLVRFQQPVDSAPARAIAQYQSGFQASSPGASWLYGWNPNGPVDQVASFRSCNWHTNSQRYADTGLVWPETTGELASGHLGATGGRPGLGVLNGAAQDRFVMVGYRARYAGFYSLQGSATVNGGGSNGVELGAWRQSGTTMTIVQSPTGTGALSHTFGPFVAVTLQAGDILWVGVGPNGRHLHDDFTMNFTVLFDESAF